MTGLRTIVALAAGTLVSEDLTCIAAGQLVRMDHAHWGVAIAGCFAGIYAGDLGLWMVGRTLGRRALNWRWLRKRIKLDEQSRFARWFDRNSGAAILCSRFIPGARLPMYLGAGALGRKSLAFAGWTFIAALIWTPLIVLLAAALGHSFAGPFTKFFGHGWIVSLLVIALAFALLRMPRVLLDDERRGRLIARASKIWRWEFWPGWLFYLPLVPWIGYLTIRHRSLRAISAANPGIPHGGFVGESKFEILSKLCPCRVLPGFLVNDIADFDGQLKRRGQRGWHYPLILKPDAGQRGAGVRLVYSRQGASDYLRSHAGPILVQAFHPGPHEAGIFYYRISGEARGRIFSITDKRFPQLTGDGVHTLRQLIWRHPRFRMQAETFFKRHAEQLDRVLADGETMPLAMAGNHCQGTLFCDGEHLITPELEAKIDSIARSFDGFYFGRFDVRYSDVEAFRRGDDFAIVELNGITSESTNLYDPDRSLPWAYRTLFAQWSILFRIGAANVRRGHPTSRLRDVVRESIAFYRSRDPDLLAD